MQNSKNIWIIGASSGIGKALALKLSLQGHNVAISARSEDKINEIITKLSGANNLALPLDVNDNKIIHQAFTKLQDTYKKIDSVIFMAGTYAPMGFDGFDIEKAHQIIDTNLKGAVNVINEVIPYFKSVSGGQIVLCGSVAGYRGLPNSQPYAATKAAIISLAESMNIEMERYNIDVKVINPGFVETPMTAKNTFPMPMMITSEQAALEIAKGLDKKGFEIHFPKKFTFIMKLLKLLPFQLYRRIMQRIL